jgi:hypothetical protein
LHRDVVEALVAGGVRVLPHLIGSLERSVAIEDAEGVRYLLDVAIRLPVSVIPEVLQRILGLLRHWNSEIREAAVDTLYNLALPHGRVAIPTLKQLAAQDPDASVQTAAREALTRLITDFPTLENLDQGPFSVEEENPEP